MGLNPLEKTELWINHITLEKVNLTSLARSAADTLGLDRDKVLVVDVRPDHITLDILAKDIPAENIAGKERELLDALKSVPGVRIGPETYIHSNGILGLLCLKDPDAAAAVSEKASAMAGEIREKIAKRAIVFPTGFELSQGLIEDTNTPFLLDLLEKEGFKAVRGEIISDDVFDVENKLEDALSRAFGLIITTGGVGAEDKDKLVEGILRVDSGAAVPYIMKFEKGTGRHVKDGVRIAVARVGPSWIAALPGPNDEVRAASRVLLDCLARGLDKENVAGAVASALAETIGKKQHTFHH